MLLTEMKRWDKVCAPRRLMNCTTYLLAIACWLNNFLSLWCQSCKVSMKQASYSIVCTRTSWNCVRSYSSERTKSTKASLFWYVWTAKLTTKTLGRSAVTWRITTLWISALILTSAWWKQQAGSFLTLNLNNKKGWMNLWICRWTSQ